MERYFVYILECSDSSYYTGVTNNIDRRFAEHQDGIDSFSYTYYRRPVNLVFQQDFQEIKEAIAFEKQIKKWSRAKKEALIRGDWEQLKELSKCNNESSHLNRRKEK
ncbi:GIY-YIG nuclease family protein [Algoriphagus halophilus]|uniref:GIY-YIG nuclease family protein n=1 Tax=Algoriphagus halophilus TaxID=226505 RepID=UPI00358DF065